MCIVVDRILMCLFAHLMDSVFVTYHATSRMILPITYCPVAIPILTSADCLMPIAYCLSHCLLLVAFNLLALAYLCECSRPACDHWLCTAPPAFIHSKFFIRSFMSLSLSIYTYVFIRMSLSLSPFILSLCIYIYINTIYINICIYIYIYVTSKSFTP